MCLCANNLAPSSKRAVGLALLVTIGNFGGFIGSNIFLDKEAPKYPAGFGTCLGILIVSVSMTILLRLGLQRENKRKDEFMVGKTAEEVRAQYTDEEWLNLGGILCDCCRERNWATRRCGHCPIFRHFADAS
jgi:hypothetical protein